MNKDPDLLLTMIFFDELCKKNFVIVFFLNQFACHLNRFSISHFCPLELSHDRSNGVDGLSGVARVKQ